MFVFDEYSHNSTSICMNVCYVYVFNINWKVNWFAQRSMVFFHHGKKVKLHLKGLSLTVFSSFDNFMIKSIEIHSLWNDSYYVIWIYNDLTFALIFSREFYWVCRRLLFACIMTWHWLGIEQLIMSFTQIALENNLYIFTGLEKTAFDITVSCNTILDK